MPAPVPIGCVMPDQFHMGDRVVIKPPEALAAFPVPRGHFRRVRFTAKFDSELGQPEAVVWLDEFGRAGS